MGACVEETKPARDKNKYTIILLTNISRRHYIQMPHGRSGRVGGEAVLQDQVFRPNIPGPLRRWAEASGCALSCLIGIAARNSVASGKPVNIQDLTTIQLQEQKPYTRIM